MSDKPYQMSMDEVYEKVGDSKHSIIKSGNIYPRLLSVLSCRLSSYDSAEAEEILVERLDLFNRYKEEDEDFPTSDEDKIFLISVALWEQCVQRKHKETHPVRGLDIMNCYVQSTEPELADRYLELFRKEFAEKMYDRLKIQGEDMEDINSNYDEEKVRDSVVNGVLLILVWHKTYGVVIPESQVSSENNYVLT